MYLQIRNQIFLSIIFGYFSLTPSVASFRLESCKVNLETTILGRDLSNSARYYGKIDAELTWNKTSGVALVKEAIFEGRLQYLTYEKIEPFKEFTLNISSLKALRVQRLIEYSANDFKDIVKPQCSVSFIYDDNISFNIPVAVEDGIISNVEKCIEDQICNLGPNSHRMGNDIHVIAHSREETTSQETLNAAIDFILHTLIDGLIKSNKSLLTIPQFELSAGLVGLSSLGGLVDILKYLKRQDDLLIQQEGRRYIIESMIKLTGGEIQLHNMSVTTYLGNFIDGELPINMTDTSLRIKVAFDYEQNRCRISVHNLVLDVPSDQINFSAFKIPTFFSETDVETILGTLYAKSLVVSAIESQLEGFLKDQVEKLSCEDYRDMIFQLGIKS